MMRRRWSKVIGAVLALLVLGNRAHAAPKSSVGWLLNRVWNVESIEVKDGLQSTDYSDLPATTLRFSGNEHVVVSYFDGCGVRSYEVTFDGRVGSIPPSTCRLDPLVRVAASTWNGSRVVTTRVVLSLSALIRHVFGGRFVARQEIGGTITHDSLVRGSTTIRLAEVRR